MAQPTDNTGTTIAADPTATAPTVPTAWEAIQAILNGPTEMRKMRNRALEAVVPNVPGATIPPASPPRTIAQALSELATNSEVRTPANAAALMAEGGRTFAQRQDMPLSGPVNAHLVSRAVQQTAAGFNDKIGNLLYLPSDIETNIVRGATDAMGVQRDPTPSPHDSYNQTFVVPGGPPSGMLEKSLRKGGEAAGTALPIFAGGAGLAPAFRGVAGVLRTHAGDLLDWLAANPFGAIATGTQGAFSAGSASQRARAAAQQAGFIDQGPAPPIGLPPP